MIARTFFNHKARRVLIAAACLVSFSTAGAQSYDFSKTDFSSDPSGTVVVDGKSISWRTQGLTPDLEPVSLDRQPHVTTDETGQEIFYRNQGSLTLPNSTDYAWWYGCSPTSMGMILGHYDRNGYQNTYFGNLVAGGVANQGFGLTQIVKDTIATSEHVADYWGNPDPLASGRTLPDDWNCLADYMKTSVGTRSNGGTTFYYYSISPLHWNNANSEDGMRGAVEYIRSIGYDVTTAYTQRTDNRGGGFDFNDYKTEIDAGRVLLVHVDGHTMFGHGYDDSDAQNPRIVLSDTWASGGRNDGGTMAWGGSYQHSSGALELWGVSVFHLDTSTGLTNADFGSASSSYDHDGYDGSTAGLPGGATVLDATMDATIEDDGGDGWLSLKFFYDDAQLADAGITDESLLRMVWDDAGTWTFDGTGEFFLGDPQGGLGDFGVNVDDNFAWINVDHASTWALAEVPEPATMSLLLLGAPLLLRRRPLA